MVTREAATAIAVLVAAVRPGWLQSSILTQIGNEAKDADPATVALALLLGARDPETRTPRRALVAGSPIWQRACEIFTAPVPRHPDRSPRGDEECRTHPTQWAIDCPACATDRAVDAAHADLRASCTHQDAFPISYSLRGPSRAERAGWHCPDCDLTTDTDPTTYPKDTL